MRRSEGEINAAKETAFKAEQKTRALEESLLRKERADRSTRTQRDQNDRDAHLPNSGRDNDNRSRANVRQQVRHLVVADSHTREMIPRELGNNVRICTMGGKNIQDGQAYFESDRSTFEPSDTVTLHLGANTILQNKNMSQNDLVNMALGDFDELLRATRRRYPKVRILLSEMFSLGRMISITEEKRALISFN